MNGRTLLTTFVIGGALLGSAASAPAEDKPASAEAAAHPGKTLLAAKCFQCHNDAMFRDQRQDRRAWESALYRMVGRGALWTRDEIAAMADHLAQDYGPNVPPTPAAR